MERIDDLLTNGLRLIQDDTEFCFCCDAVELANFVDGGSGDHAVDLGCGNGIITVLLAGKKGIKTTGVDISESLCKLARRNIALNNLDGMADVINLPMQRLPEVLARGSRSLVVCNPPYYKAGSGFVKSGSAAAARHELCVTLAEVLDTAEYLLPQSGRFFVVYTADRLAELISLCRQKGLEPKELVLLSPKADLTTDKDGVSPRLCLLKCVKGSRTGLKVFVRTFGDYSTQS